MGMQISFLLSESRCIGDCGEFKPLVQSIGGFVWQLVSGAGFLFGIPLFQVWRTSPQS